MTETSRKSICTIAALLLGSSLTATQAQARENTRSFTCGALKNYVDRSGAVVLNTRGPRVYKRFVRSRAYCSSFEIIEWEWVTARDGRCALKICWEPLSRGDQFRPRF